MAKKPNFLKNLLTTASALAVVASAVNAYATDVISIGGAGTFSNGTNFLVTGAKPANVAAGSNVFFGNATGMTLDQVGNYGVLNAYGFSQLVTVTQAASFTNIVNDVSDTSKAAAKLAANTLLLPNANAALPGNVANALVNFSIGGVVGNVEFKAIDALGTINFTDNAAIAKFSGDNTTVTKAIAAGNGNGNIQVNATNVTFGSTIGANVALINTFTVNDGKSATLSDNAFVTNAVTIGNGANGGILNVNKNITAADIAGSADGKGVLKFGGASVVASNIGNANALLEMNIGAGTVELAFGGFDTLKAKSIILTKDNAALKLSTATTTVTGDITTTVAGKGKIVANAATPVFIGNIGSATNGLILEAIELGANAATFKQAAATDLSVNAIGIKGTTAAAEAHFQSDKNITINTDIGTSTVKFATVTFEDINHVGLVATKATLGAGKTIYSTNVDLALTNGIDNILILGQGSAVKGNVFATQAGNGILQVAGDSTVTKIGNGAAIKYLEFTEAKTLNLESDATVGVNDANGLRFTADGTLNYTGVDEFILDKAIQVPVNASGTGSIIANNLRSIVVGIQLGGVGNPLVANTSLKLIQVTGGGSIQLESGASVKEIDLGSSDSLLFLKTHDANYLIEKLVHDNGKVSLSMDYNITLKAGSSFSTDKSALKQVLFSDNTVKIEDGVNLYTTQGFYNDKANRGSLTFTGASVVSGKVGVNNKFNGIAVTGNGKLVEFKNEVNLDNNVTISEGATVQFDDVITADNIGGDKNNHGTVKFSNKVAIDVEATVGSAGNTLDTVEINGTGVTFKNADFGTNNLKFTSTAAATAGFDAAADATFDNMTITSNGKGIHHVRLNKDHDYIFNSAVGTQANPMGNFTLVADNTVPAPVAKTVTINTAFFGKVITDTINTGNVILQSGSALNLGNATKQLLGVTFQGNASVGDVYSKTITVNAGQTGTFKGVVKSSADGGITLDNASTAAFSKNSSLNSTINGVVAGDGVVTFDAATINSVVGGARAVNSITLTGVNKVGANLKANTISVVANGTLAATTDVALDGATTVATGGTVDIADNTVRFKGANSVFNGTSNINVTINKDGKAGDIIVDGAGANLDLSKATAATAILINVNDLQLSLPESNSYTLIKVDNGGTLTNGTVKIGESTRVNRFSQLALDTQTANTVKLIQTNTAASELAKLVNSVNSNSLTNDATSLGDAKNSADAQAVQNDLGKITNDATLVEAVRRLTTPIETNSAVMNNVAIAGKNVVSNRLGHLSPTPGIQTSDAGTSGVAAGDDARFGAWVAPFFNQNTQKAKGSAAGYKANSFGGTIGFDTMTNADMTIGLAGTFAKTDVKHKDIKSGDKTKADTFIFSIYGVQQLTNEWFMQAVASFSSSKVKNKEKRITSAGAETASGSFDTTTYGADVMLGYGQKFGATTLTPMFGVNFSRINDGGYKETGTTNQNLSVTKKAVNKFEFVAGLRAQFDSMTTSDIELTPEAHGFVKYDVIGKNPTVTTKLDGLVTPFTPKSAKVEKATYNVGFSVNAESGMYEYGAGYDLTAANKFIGHQGIVKLRVNF